MFESLKRAFSELFESVMLPIKNWILAQSWIVRLLFLSLACVAAFAYWKPQTSADLVQQTSFYWRSWRGEEGAIPLSAPAQEALEIAVRRLSQTVEADLTTDLDQSHLTPWSASQSVLALRSAEHSVPDKYAFVAFVNSRRFAADCFCWTELHDGPRHEVLSFVGGWVLAAFAGLDVPITAADYDYVLNLQSPAGWWPMFPESGASQLGSAYSTAWLVLGLHRQREAGLVPTEKLTAVDRAISRARAWLLRSRQGARWTAHANTPNSETPETLSGFVLYVLNEVGGIELTDVKQAWLDALPIDRLEPSSIQKHYTILRSGNRQVIDHFVEVRLPWILVGTTAAYSSGSLAQKARTLHWLEQVLRHPGVRGSDTEGIEWVRAEVLIGLAEARKHIDCAECKNGSAR